MRCDEFRLHHYAREVTYNIHGFMEKNNDLLFRDLKETISKSGNSILRACYELKSKKRPDVAITQFRNSLNNLMSILMCKEPSYIRCIKPNDVQARGVFTDELVLHQVKYLSLMENLRVRRAGFAYRRVYDVFLIVISACAKQNCRIIMEAQRKALRCLSKHFNLNLRNIVWVRQKYSYDFRKLSSMSGMPIKRKTQHRYNHSSAMERYFATAQIFKATHPDHWIAIVLAEVLSYKSG